METACKWYCSSALNYDPKPHLKCELVPLDLYVAHTSAVRERRPAAGAAVLEPTRNDKTLKQFPNYAAVGGGMTRGAGGIAAGVRSGWAWFFNPYFQVGFGALLVTASELLLKVGAATRGGAIGAFGVAALASGYTWAGIVLYCLSFVSWMHVLRRLPLGVAFALVNVVHVLIPVGCWLFLHERISARRWLGIALVVAGLLLVVKPAAQAEEKLGGMP